MNGVKKYDIKDIKEVGLIELSDKGEERFKDNL